MSIRYLIATAFLFGTAYSAQAGVLPAAGNGYSSTGSALVGVYNGRRVAVAGGSSSAATSLPGAVGGQGGAHGSGATVITPAESGNTGGAIVQLPIPAQNHGNDAGGSAGADLPPVTLPLAPAPVAADPVAAAPTAAVPEPSSIALLMAGMLGALGVSRRRKR
jgi:hypothetical protein